MRKLKTLLAVAATATMTMAMGIVAFADQTITFHFQNSQNWDKVGGYIFQGIGWTTNVTDNTYLVNPKSDGTQKKLWPGALCEADKDGWVKCTATFTDDVVTDGMIFKFNNFVADSETNSTTEQDDVDFIMKSGIKTTATDKKLETDGVLINKKNAILSSGTIPTDIYVEYDGKLATPSSTAPDSYTNAGGGSAAPADNNSAAPADNSSAAAPADNSSAAAPADNSSAAAPANNTSSNTSASAAPKATVAFDDGTSADGYSVEVKTATVPDALKNNNVKAVYDIDLLKDGAVTKVDDKKVKVTLDLASDLRGYQNYEVVYIENGAIKETLPATVSGGKITFTTTHFSQYGIVATGKAPQTGDTVAVSAIILAIAAAAVVVVSKKKVNA